MTISPSSVQAPQIDVVIVGAGTAGCVLADRLSADGRQQVMLLEAGGPDRAELLHVPAGFNYVAFDPRLIWDYKTEPEAGLQGRRIDYVRGRVLGGSSSVNAMVHVRGNPGNYEAWAAAGCRGWSWSEVLPYFIRSEQHCYGASDLHGATGPLPVTQAHRHRATDAFIAAMIEAGIPASADLSSLKQEGAGYYHQTVLNGRRQSGAQTYLKRARGRPNLRIESNILALRVSFQGTQAEGIWVQRPGATPHLIRARRVILAGGTVGSAQLLELSGIGDAGLLRPLGIEVRVDRPAVGENVQDHYQAPVVINLRGIASLNRHANLLGLAGQILRYYLRRDGLLAFNATQAGAFVKTSAELEWPDLQLLFAPGAIDQLARPRRLDRIPGVTAITCALQPRSRGSIHVRSNQAGDYPRIVGGYLQDAYDCSMTVAGLRLLRRVFAQPAFAPFVASEKVPGSALQSDVEILDYCRRRGDSVHHPVGSCRMGEDPSAVVDSNLQVRGVTDLYVIDASVMPRIISGNTNAATVMIAEKGADIVKAALQTAPSTSL